MLHIRQFLLRGFFFIFTFAAAVFAFAPKVSIAGDLPALSSWNDTGPKKAITEFVAKVTTEGSPNFVKPEDRIAVFDNDGTLWCEHPVYTQLFFVLDRIKALAPQHPEWKTTEPYKSALAGDLRGVQASGEKGLVELLMVTHAGMSAEDFKKIVAEWFKASRHPRFKKPFNELTYKPMVELLAYLRAAGFKTFIVSGGGVEFMRPITAEAYGIPSEQVVGSTISTKLEVQNGVPMLIREPKIDFVDDGPGKPVGINKFIGKRPIMAFGNSDGDLQMLEWTSAGTGSRFGLIVHHTDAEREYAYDRETSIGKLDKALDAAPKAGWTVVDMKTDWKNIF